MICILKVVEGPAIGMKCWLNRDQRITVGRLSTADLSIAADQHLSRTHLIVEGSELGFRLRDGGSANGTYVNDARVTLIELRVGDRIRAGTSVLTVEFEEDLAATDVRDRSRSHPEDLSIPQRTLSMNDLQGAIEGLTARFKPKQAAAEIKGTPAVTPPEIAPSEVAPPDGAPSLPASATENDDIPTSVPMQFLQNFPEQQTPFLWVQRPDNELHDPTTIVDQLSRAVWNCELCLIVNRSQLDQYEQGKLDEAVAEGVSRQLTETLYSVSFKRKADLLRFYKHCLHRDAAVLVATPNPIQDRWIIDAIDALSYPSMLFEMLKNSDVRAKKIAHGTHFLLFEVNPDGGMCMLRAS